MPHPIGFITLLWIFMGECLRIGVLGGYAEDTYPASVLEDAHLTTVSTKTLRTILELMVFRNIVATFDKIQVSWGIPSSHHRGQICIDASSHCPAWCQACALGPRPGGYLLHLDLNGSEQRLGVLPLREWLWRLDGQCPGQSIFKRSCQTQFKYGPGILELLLAWNRDVWSPSHDRWDSGENGLPEVELLWPLPGHHLILRDDFQQTGLQCKDSHHECPGSSCFHGKHEGTSHKHRSHGHQCCGRLLRAVSTQLYISQSMP